jgi:sigma-E factor negative regulatory protein RseA
MPAALAAGVMGLATVLVASLGPGGQGGAPALARAPAASVPATVAIAQPPAAADSSVAEAVPAGGRVLRDAQLDRYLRAHRDYAATSPGSLPGGAGRSISTVSLDR